MKGLSQFVFFDWNGFSQGKQFVVTSVGEYSDYETKEHLGTKIDCIISIDKTPYSFKNGQAFTNRYEKITFKVNKDVNVPLESHVAPKGQVVAKIYGEFRNQLSVTCEDIAVATGQVSPPSSSKKEI